MRERLEIGATDERGHLRDTVEVASLQAEFRLIRKALG